MKNMTLEILSAEELYGRGEISGLEMQTFFNGKTVMRFSSEIQALAFAKDFFRECLIPKYGRDGAARFYMTKLYPSRDFEETINEIARTKKHNPNKETWLLIENHRYHEVQKYIDTHPELKS